jgi:hypothetical protein
VGHDGAGARNQRAEEAVDGFERERLGIRVRGKALGERIDLHLREALLQGTAILAQTSSLGSLISSLNCQPSYDMSICPNCSQVTSRSPSLEMTPGQGAVHALDELRHEGKEIALGIAEDPESIAAGGVVLELEGVEDRVA